MKPSRLAVVGLLSLCHACRAQAPHILPVQGRLTNASGATVADSTFTIAFNVYAAATGGAPLARVTKSVQTKGGIFSSSLDFFGYSLAFDQPYFVGVQVAGDPEMVPRLALAAVPYAMGLTLPITASVASGPAGISITNTANGAAGYFSVTNPASISPALDAISGTQGNAVIGVNNGTGPAATFEVTNAASAGVALTAISIGNGDAFDSTAAGLGDAVSATTTGTRRAGTFVINNSANSFAALYGNTNGTGKAISGVNDGTGIGGFFQITSGANDSDAVYGTTIGSGAGVHGVASGSGSTAVQGDVTGLGAAGYFKVSNSGNPSNAVYGQTNGIGPAVYGYSTGTREAGKFIISNGANVTNAVDATTNGSGNAVQGTANGTGSGVYGRSNGSGSGVTADGGGGSSPALEIVGGPIKVTGAGIGTNTAAFEFCTTAANTSSYFATINNAMTNGQPNAILIVTPNQTPAGGLHGFSNHPVAVSYSNSTGKWVLVNEDLSDFATDICFNILVIKP